nr:hypothetical protein [Tanacetum cinerariifolium]
MVEPAEVEEVIEVVTATNLMTKVVTTAAATTTAATTIIAALMPKASSPRRRKGVIIQDPEEATTASLNDKSYARELEAKLNANINWNEVIEQVKRKEKQDNTVMRYQALKRIPVTEAHARKNMMNFNSFVAFREKGEKEIEEEESEESKESKRKSKSSEQKQLRGKGLMKKEDLEMLWKIVQERFASSEPKNFSDDFF